MTEGERKDLHAKKTILESYDPGDTLDLGEEEGGAPEPDVTPEAPGRYDVLREIASGGIGRIMLVFDRHVGRSVALKEVLPHLLPDKDSGGRTPKSPSRMVKARFLREARVTGQLEHPAIVPVYEIGRHPDGTYYYTMRLVEGRTLARAIAESLDLAERLTLLPHFYNLCNAIAYAHSRGVLHRDIKPENVMLGPFGETVVLDWGLAKVRGERDHGARHLERHLSLIRESDGEKTMSGRIVGTPAYMPPEQARGELERLDERSDVYALGAVLYEILTGKRPFEGKTSYDILNKVIDEMPVPIAAWEPQAPVELVAIAERAMRKRPEERYANVAEMTQDINNYLAGRRVSAHRYSLWELVGKFFATNRTVAVAGIVAISLILIGAALVYREYLHAQESLAVSRSFLYAERSRAYEKARNRGASAVLAAAALVNNPAVASRRFVLPGIERRHPEIFPLYADIRSRLYQADLGLGAQFKGVVVTSGTVWAVAVSPDGRTVAAGGHAKGDRVVQIYDRVSGTMLGELKGISGNVYAIAFSPDGTLLAAATQEPRVLLWDVVSREQKKPLAGPESALFAVAFSPDGKRIAAAGLDGYLRVWERESGTLLFESEAHREGALCVAFSPDGEVIASGGWDKRVVLWNATNGRLLRVVGEHRDAVSALSFSPDGRRLVSGGHDRVMAFWNLVTGEQRAVHGHVGLITALSYTDDGRYLASAGDDNAVKVWDVASGELLLRLEVHRKTVATAAFHGPRFLVTGGNDRLLKFWELTPGRETTTYAGHTAPISAATLLPGATLLLSTAEDGTLRFWDLVKGFEILQLETPPGPRALTVSPRGTFIAVGGWDRRVRLWRTGEIAPIADLKGHTDTVRALSFSPDETLLLSTGDDSTVRLWKSTGEAVSVRMSGHHGPVLSARFVGDENHYATGGADGLVFLRETATGKEIGRIEVEGAARTIATIPSEETLVIGGESAAVLFYDRALAQVRRRLDIGERGVVGLTISSDGATLAVVCESGTVRLFSVADGRPRLSLETAGSRTVLFGPSGEYLITADGFSLKRYPAASLVLDDDPRSLFERIQCATGLRLVGTGVEPVEKTCTQ